MNISLDDTEAEYIVTKLKADQWWIAEKIKSKIDAGFKADLERHNCKHKTGHYIGEMDCCVKCGGYSEGQGQSWTLVKSSKKKNERVKSKR